MNFICVLSCLSLLLAAAAAQRPKPCESPPLMTGRHTSMFSEGMTATGTITYDALAQRVRVRDIGLGNHTFFYDQLILLKENVYYMIDWTTNTCTKSSLYGSFSPMGVPDDANLNGQYFMGSSSSLGMGVLVNNWYGDLPGNGSYSFVFTETGCIPITFSIYNPTDGWVTLSTFDWVTGISNPSDFYPPSICETAQLEETEQPHTFFSALKSLARLGILDK